MAHCYETRFNPNVPQLTCSLQIIISHIYISHFIDFLKYFTGSLTKKGHFYLFSPIFTQPRQIWLFSRVFGPFLPSEMIINIIWDEYGSILTFTFFGFLHFLPILGIFGHFCIFMGFSGGWGGFGGATEL